MKIFTVNTCPLVSNLDLMFVKSESEIKHQSET